MKKTIVIRRETGAPNTFERALDEAMNEAGTWFNDNKVLKGTVVFVWCGLFRSAPTGMFDFCYVFEAEDIP